MAQQTAVEWLENVYDTQWHILPSQFEQAKQMEKEQIENAYIKGNEHESFWPSESANNYYKETYGK